MAKLIFFSQDLSLLTTTLGVLFRFESWEELETEEVDAGEDEEIVKTNLKNIEIILRHLKSNWKRSSKTKMAIITLSTINTPQTVKEEAATR